MNDLRFNVDFMPEKYDGRDYKLVIKDDILPKTKADLREYCSGIRDQGHIGSCVTFTVIACMEFMLRKFMNDNPDFIFGEDNEWIKDAVLSKSSDVFSEMFMYYYARTLPLKEGGNGKNIEVYRWLVCFKPIKCRQNHRMLFRKGIPL